MPAPKHTEQEFIQHWMAFKEQGKSARQLAEYLDVPLRCIHNRRRRLEKKFGLLPSLGQYCGNTLKLPENTITHLSDKPYTAIIFSDCHWWPNVESPATEILIKTIKKEKPDIVICNGDALDGYSISRHPKIGWEHEVKLKDELETCQDWMKQIHKAHPKAKHYYTYGNHDIRFNSWLSTNASQYEGISGMSIEDHFPDWEFGWSVNLNNTLVVKHRYKGGKHAAYNNTMSAGISMATGHTHNLIARPVRDYRGLRWGIETGTLGCPESPHMTYAEHNPLDMHQGFVIVRIDGESVNPECVHCE